MPVTIQPATLKYKNGQGVYQSADCLKGDKGNPGAAGNAGLIAPDYDDLTFPVEKGQHCTYDSGYYAAKQKITTQESWDASHWIFLGDIGSETQSIKDDFSWVCGQFITKASPVLVNGSIAIGNGLDVSGNTKYVRIQTPTPISNFSRFVVADPSVYEMNIYLYTGVSQYTFTRCFEDVKEWNVSEAGETELYVRYQVSERSKTNELDPAVEYVKSYAPVMDVKAEIGKKVDKNQGVAYSGQVLAINDEGEVEPAEIQIDVDETLSIQGDAADAKATGDRIYGIDLNTMNDADNISYIIGSISVNIGVMNEDTTRKNACSSGYFKASDYEYVVLKANSSLYQMDLYFYTSERWQDFVQAKNQIDVQKYRFTDDDDGYYFRVQIRSKTTETLDTSVRYADLYTLRDGVTTAQRNKDKENAIVVSKGKTQANFTLLTLTDIHGDAVRMLNAVRYLNETKEIDAGACLGDISANAYNTDCDFYKNAVLNSKKDFFTVIGNHDAGNGTAVASNGTQQQIFDKFIAPVVSKTGTETTVSYYYKDYGAKNLRVIVLNSSDVPDTLADEDTFAVSHGTLGAFSQTQVDWFISALENTPAGYHVLILMHYVNAPMTADENIEFQSSSGGGASGTENNAYSGLIQDIISAWVSGTALTQSYTSSVANMPVIEVDADFSSRGTGVFVGVLSGHRHRDIIGKFDDYPTQNACVFSLANMPRGTEDDLPRIEGTKSEDLLTVVSVDTTNRKLYLVRVGANLSINFDERENTCISY